MRFLDLQETGSDREPELYRDIKIADAVKRPYVITARSMPLQKYAVLIGSHSWRIPSQKDSVLPPP